jgi:predicted nucleic acid-binding protein
LAVLLDTDVVIHLRDGDAWVEGQFRQLDPPLHISAITRVELENGVWREPEWSKLRRDALDEILSFVTTLEFGASEIAAYQAILAAVGLSKRKTADRMTAATALTHDLTLVTLNARDFRDVPGLKLLGWTRPQE